MEFIINKGELMRILIIEDDLELAQTLKAELRTSYAVDLAQTVEDGEYLAETIEYDLIILDLVLADGDGLSVCLNLRQFDVCAPILILTAKDSPEDKVKLLDCGADDYLTKPFNISELRARIRALLRRQNYHQKSIVLTLDDLKIDVIKRTVKRRNKTIRLRRKEFEILEYLLRNRGRVLTREMIVDHIWDDSYDSLSNSVDVHIKYLRDLVDRPFNKQLIKTVHGLGYMIKE